MQSEAETWQQKASIQVQGLFNGIAKMDQPIMLEITRDSGVLAEESKRSIVEHLNEGYTTVTMVSSRDDLLLYIISENS